MHWSTDSLTETRGFLLDTEFICVLVISNKYTEYLRELVRSLQAEVRDVVEAVIDVDVVVNALQRVRKKLINLTKNAVVTFRTCAVVLGFAPSRCGHQKPRNIMPSGEPSI